jgi:hypothetical protein
MGPPTILSRLRGEIAAALPSFALGNIDRKLAR